MSWTIRDSRYCELSNPSRDEIGGLVALLEESDLPILVLEADEGDYLEAAATARRAFVLSYETGGVSRCSVSWSLPSSTVIEVFDKRVRGDESWKDLVAWRPFVWPEDGSPESKQVAEWVTTLAARVEKAGENLSDSGRVWVLRGLIRKELGQVIPGRLSDPNSELGEPLRYDMEHYLLRLAQDLTREADA